MDDSSSTPTGPETADPPPNPNTDPTSTSTTSKGDRSTVVVPPPAKG